MKRYVILAFLIIFSSVNSLAENSSDVSCLPNRVVATEDLGEVVESIPGYTIKVYERNNGTWQEYNGRVTIDLIVRMQRNGQYWAHKEGEATWEYMYRVMRSNLQGYRYYMETPSYGAYVPATRWYFNPKNF